MQNMERIMNNYDKNTIVQKGYIPLCVCEENGRKFILKNKSNLFITKIKVDGGLIKSVERCDYAVDAESKEIFLIELKGSDKPHACNQILATFNYFINNFSAKKWHARIILSKDRVPKLISNEEKRLIQLTKKRKDFDYNIRNVFYEETI